MSSAIKILGIGGGIGVAIIIGIIAYGEMTRPAGSNILERPTEQWVVGNSLKENTALTYKLSHVDNNYQNIIVTLKFIGKQDQNWRTSVTVEDTTGGKNEQELVMSKSLLPLAPAEPQMQ
ncbi:MAG: hypothetical protein ACRD32_08455, partial [Nitrososphaerales archaeon]